MRAFALERLGGSNLSFVATGLHIPQRSLSSPSLQKIVAAQMSFELIFTDTATNTQIKVVPTTLIEGFDSMVLVFAKDKSTSEFISIGAFSSTLPIEKFKSLTEYVRTAVEAKTQARKPRLATRPTSGN